MGRIKIHIVDPKFRKYKKHYLIQSALATLVLFTAMYVFNVLVAGILVASVGSTAFVLFATPHHKESGARNVVGSHVIAGLIGSAVAAVPTSAGLEPLKWGAAVGAVIFAMVATDTEHPPAAGTALAFSIQGWDPITYLSLVSLVAGVWVAARLLKSWMRDLI